MPLRGSKVPTERGKKQMSKREQVSTIARARGDAVSAYSEAISEIIVEWKVCNYEEKLSKWSSVGTVSNAYRFFYVIASAVWLVLLFFYLNPK